jgi:hypothetical protein
MMEEDSITLVYLLHIFLIKSAALTEIGKRKLTWVSELETATEQLRSHRLGSFSMSSQNRNWFEQTD